LAANLNSGIVFEVLSAFGGLSIYHGVLLYGQSYFLIEGRHPGIPVLCEHHSLHRAIRKHYPDLKFSINPKMIDDYGSLPYQAWQSIRQRLGVSTFEPS